MRENNSREHGIPFGWHIPTQRMVQVAQASRGRACECACAACGSALVARKGPIRAWYFAHEPNTQCQHAAESAIHQMAKQLIVERCSVFTPERTLSRSIHGKRRVWQETLTVTVQQPGLQMLTGCLSEKTIGLPRVGGEFRRPDVLGTLDDHPLAIEIRNTHAVDDDKVRWLKDCGYSILEINVTDIAASPSDQLIAALEARLFDDTEHSVWLTHAKDASAGALLDRMETDMRQARRADEEALLARIEAEEAEKKRREQLRQRFRDIEDYKLRIGNATVRVGRNVERVSLKVYGFAHDDLFNAVKSVARHYAARFNTRGKCWEIYSRSRTEPLFRQLCENLEIECFGRAIGFGAPSAQTNIQSVASEFTESASLTPAQTLPVQFSETELQELFNERAGIREFEAGLDRAQAEELAMSDVTTAQTTSSDVN